MTHTCGLGDKGYDGVLLPGITDRALYLTKENVVSAGGRQAIEPTDDWQQLQLMTRFPEQLTYELLRPVVLFGLSAAERVRQTGAPQRTLYRQVARFEAEGMRSLFAPSRAQRRQLPEEIR